MAARSDPPAADSSAAGQDRLYRWVEAGARVSDEEEGRRALIALQRIFVPLGDRVLKEWSRLPEVALATPSMERRVLLPGGSAGDELFLPTTRQSIERVKVAGLAGNVQQARVMWRAPSDPRTGKLPFDAIEGEHGPELARAFVGASTDLFQAAMRAIAPAERDPAAPQPKLIARYSFQRHAWLSMVEGLRANTLVLSALAAFRVDDLGPVALLSEIVKSQLMGRIGKGYADPFRPAAGQRPVAVVALLEPLLGQGLVPRPAARRTSSGVIVLSDAWRDVLRQTRQARANAGWTRHAGHSPGLGFGCPMAHSLGGGRSTRGTPRAAVPLDQFAAALTKQVARRLKRPGASR